MSYDSEGRRMSKSATKPPGDGPVIKKKPSNQTIVEGGQSYCKLHRYTKLNIHLPCSGNINIFTQFFPYNHTPIYLTNIHSYIHSLIDWFFYLSILSSISPFNNPSVIYLVHTPTYSLGF